MPRVQASIVLPYLLELEDGRYATGAVGAELAIQAVRPWSMRTSTAGPLQRESLSGGSEAFPLESATIVTMTEDLPDTEVPDEQGQLNARLADRLLLLTNRLIRAYRATSRNASITELSRAEASPFRFRVVGEREGDFTWRAELIYGTTLPEVPAQAIASISERVRALMSSGREPEVADLFLLDAELAIHEGRFREAVLFCWSTIDATFNRKYDRLVETKLSGEWKEARDFFTGLDFRMRNKMSAGLFLLVGRSFFREPGDFWERLSRSYNRRNGIIHRGDSADEADARMALEVARRVVEIMGEF